MQPSAAVGGGFRLDLCDASCRCRLTVEQMNWSPAYLANCKRQFIIIKSGVFDWHSVAEMHTGPGNRESLSKGFASCFQAAGLKKKRTKERKRVVRSLTIPLPVF